MKKRLMVGLMAGGLMAAMLPGGVAAVDESCQIANPSVDESLQCITATRAELKDVYREMDQAAKELQKKLKAISKDGGSVTFADISEIQALQTKIGQLSSTSTVVVSAANTAVSSMARNIKG